VSGSRVDVDTRIACLSASPLEERPDVAMLAHPVALLAEGATEAPKELRLFAAGLIETTKGIFKFDDDSGASVLRCWADVAHDYPFDYEHASAFAMFAPDPAEAGKAAGWFKPAIRNGECWATEIEWTPKAREKILAKEFRYTSPTFRHDDEGRVLELYACALTNIPATKGAKPVINSRGEPAAKEPTMLKLLAARLGLPGTATEDEIIAALSRHQDESKATASALAGLIALSGKPTANEASGVFQAWKSGAEQVPALSAKVTDLSGRLDEVEKAKAAVEIDTIVKAAMAAGKIAPASEKLAREMGAKDLAMLKAWVETLPVIVTPAAGAAAPPPGAPPPVVQLTADQAKIAATLGVKPEDVLKHMPGAAPAK
jgi:phage I-like protein